MCYLNKGHIEIVYVWRFEVGLNIGYLTSDLTLDPNGSLGLVIQKDKHFGCRIKENSILQVD